MIGNRLIFFLFLWIEMAAMFIMQALMNEHESNNISNDRKIPSRREGLVEGIMHFSLMQYV